MEVKLIKFLRDNMVTEPSLILQNEYDKKMIAYSKKRDEYNYLKYLIASYIAINLGDDVDITKYFKKIYKKDYQYLLTEINDKIKNGRVFKK